LFRCFIYVVFVIKRDVIINYVIIKGAVVSYIIIKGVILRDVVVVVIKRWYYKGCQKV